jgi:hypothetical protein
MTYKIVYQHFNPERCVWEERRDPSPDLNEEFTFVVYDRTYGPTSGAQDQKIVEVRCQYLEKALRECVKSSEFLDPLDQYRFGRLLQVGMQTYKPQVSN